VADLYLRAAWCCKVADEVIDPESQRWAIEAARQQRDFAREWFA
jgi:hypothetical protein